MTALMVLRFAHAGRRKSATAGMAISPRGRMSPLATDQHSQLTVPVPEPEQEAAQLVQPLLAGQWRPALLCRRVFKRLGLISHPGAEFGR